jgi:hypothetical protein
MKTKLHRMTWYTVSCRKTAMGLLLYRLFSMVKGLLIFMFGLGSNGCFVINAPCLNGGHGYSFARSVGHPRSDSAMLLVYDGMHTYPEHWCCITGPSGQHQPCRD